MSTNYLQAGLRVIRYAYALLGGAMVALLGFILVNSYVFTYYQVEGSSMFPTLHNGESVPVNLLAYIIQPPHVGDVVIVRYAEDGNITLVKRVVAGPGMTVSYRGMSIELGEGEYFVEGDNRLHSTDSRSFGPVQRQQIIGKVLQVSATDAAPLE